MITIHIGNACIAVDEDEKVELYDCAKMLFKGTAIDLVNDYTGNETIYCECGEEMTQDQVEQNKVCDKCR